MLNVIEAVVNPLKADAMDKAEKYARAAVAAARKELKDHNNDIHAVAPYPSGLNTSRLDYMAALGKYKFFSSITTWRPDQRVQMNGPCFVDVDSNLVAKFVKDARENAAFQYEQFVAKLNKKIGPAISADLEGNHVWSYSFLRVVTASGEKQTWKTQTIINVSKLGKVFNQFPTRKVKE